MGTLNVEEMMKYLNRICLRFYVLRAVKIPFFKVGDQ